MPRRCTSKSARLKMELLVDDGSGILCGGPKQAHYEPVEESQENLRLMQLIDRQYTRAPFYGKQKITAWLRAQGRLVCFSTPGQNVLTS
jgi:putative transposase